MGITKLRDSLLKAADYIGAAKASAANNDMKLRRLRLWP
jgi:hypothetical protein